MKRLSILFLLISSVVGAQTNYSDSGTIRDQCSGDLLQTLFDVNDEFTAGNKMLVLYEKLQGDGSGEKEFAPGKIVDINLYGVSEQYHNYIKLLIRQSGGQGGPFSTTPAEINGNCINTTNPENYAFGYFRLTEVDKKVYQFE